MFATRAKWLNVKKIKLGTQNHTNYFIFKIRKTSFRIVIKKYTPNKNFWQFL